MLTQEQIEKLHKAIEQAREPGGCQYVKDGAPCCVVAQLAALEGISLETLKQWNTDDRGVAQFKELRDRDANALADKYGRLFLQDLQQIWDDADSLAARKDMRDRVARELTGN